MKTTGLGGSLRDCKFYRNQYWCVIVRVSLPSLCLPHKAPPSQGSSAPLLIVQGQEPRGKVVSIATHFLEVVTMALHLQLSI